MCKLAEVVMLGFLGWCAWSDWRTKEISICTLLIYSILGVLLTIICGKENISSVIGGGLLGIFFLLVSRWTKEAIGYGDSWIIFILGIYLGWKKTLWLLLLASSCAGICSLLYMWKRRWKRNDTLPFVPFLFIGYMGMWFL